MKTKLITLLLCICPLLLYAQDYKKEGDELFQQAQYEKAIKKYNAYIAFAGEDPAVSKRIANAEKCNSLLSRAKSAEQAAAESSDVAKYEEASRLYSELYSLHPLSSYKSKASQLQNKADAIRMERERAEQAEQERQAILEAERKAKLEAERKAEIEKERKNRAEKAKIEAEKKAEQERQAKIKSEQERQAKLESEKARLQSEVLVFEKTEHDFGKIKEGNGKVSVVFGFKNYGKNPLILSNVVANCGCMSVIWSKEPVPQGQSGSITVTYDPSGRPGSFQKTVTISSNAPVTYRKLYIKGEVIP